MAIVSHMPELTRQALKSGKPLEGRIAPIGESIHDYVMYISVCMYVYI